MTKKLNILIAEDIPSDAELAQRKLRSVFEDFNVLVVETEKDFVAGLEDFKPDLIISDYAMPTFTGLVALNLSMKLAPSVPFVMLTGSVNEEIAVECMKAGADDYVTKPFSIRELMARVKAILRRVEELQSPQKKEIPSKMHVGEMEIDPTKRKVIIGENKIELTAKEFDLLFFFAKHAGQVFTRSQLLDKVWGYGHDGYEHTVNSHINRLRSKIELNPAQPQYILTTWGVGYQFKEIEP